MNKTFLLVTSGLILSACATPQTLNPALTDCDKQFWGWCQGDDDVPTIKIKTGGKKLKVKPYCIDAAKQSELVFRIVPRNKYAVGEVTIEPKNPAHDWLKGTNSPRRNFIFIDVPPDLDPKGDYFYGITIGDRCLDPRVNVKN